MLRKTKADIGKFQHQLFVLVCVSEIVAAVYQIIICYFTAHEHLRKFPILAFCLQFYHMGIYTILFFQIPW